MLGLCASLQCDCLNSSWRKEPYSRSCRESCRESWPSGPSQPPGCPANILLIPPLPLHLLLASHNSISSLHPPFPHHPPPFPPPFPTPSGNLEGLQALPSCLQRPVGQALDCQLQVWSPPPPRFQNNYRFKIIHRLRDIDRSHMYHKTLMFRFSNNV